MEIKKIIEELGATEKEASDELMIEEISVRVADMMDENIELLMSYLYRLDVEESKINHALKMSNVILAPTALATLIWERQKQRLATKKKYKQGPIEGWEY